MRLALRPRSCRNRNRTLRLMSATRRYSTAVPHRSFPNVHADRRWLRLWHQAAQGRSSAVLAHAQVAGRSRRMVDRHRSGDERTPGAQGKSQAVDKGWLAGLLADKPELGAVLHWDPENRVLGIEDPQLVFFIRNLLWNKFVEPVGQIESLRSSLVTTWRCRLPGRIEQSLRDSSTLWILDGVRGLLRQERAGSNLRGERRGLPRSDLPI